MLQDAEASIEIMPQARFDQIETMEFEVETLKGVTWRDSARVTERVFTTPGDYLVYFADNLETEPENTFSFQASVRYR